MASFATYGGQPVRRDLTSLALYKLVEITLQLDPTQVPTVQTVTLNGGAIANKLGRLVVRVTNFRTRHSVLADLAELKVAQALRLDTLNKLAYIVETGRSVLDELQLPARPEWLPLLPMEDNPIGFEFFWTGENASNILVDATVEYQDRHR